MINLARSFVCAPCRVVAYPTQKQPHDVIIVTPYMSHRNGSHRDPAPALAPTFAALSGKTKLLLRPRVAAGAGGSGGANRGGALSRAGVGIGSDFGTFAEPPLRAPRAGLGSEKLIASEREAQLGLTTKQRDILEGTGTGDAATAADGTDAGRSGAAGGAGANAMAALAAVKDSAERRVMEKIVGKKFLRNAEAAAAAVVADAQPAVAGQVRGRDGVAQQSGSSAKPPNGAAAAATAAIAPSVVCVAPKPAAVAGRTDIVAAPKKLIADPRAVMMNQLAGRKGGKGR